MRCPKHQKVRHRTPSTKLYHYSSKLLNDPVLRVSESVASVPEARACEPYHPDQEWECCCWPRYSQRELVARDQ